MIKTPTIIQEFTTSLKGKKQAIEEALRDYWICRVSREASLMGRREVLTGKAKFGILGDGKELPQVVMAKSFQKGDWRSGYYRDQTLMFALGLSSVEDFFAQLYADAENDPFSGGRQMNSHFSTPTVDENGDWNTHKDQYNISSDISPTAGQMARGLGLAFASQKYRELPALKGTAFSDNGNEVCFCTIGDASTSEGIFWESINAAGVLQIPMAVSVWDDGYGISVPKKYQTTKQSISEVLKGFKRTKDEEGIEIYKVDAYDYEGLKKTYAKAIKLCREDHVPVLVHVENVTQPQGHSTSGSHERYKSKERLEWEKEHDCILQFRNWILDKGYAGEELLEAVEKEAKKYVREAKGRAWSAYIDPIKALRVSLLDIYGAIEANIGGVHVTKQAEELKEMITPSMAEILQNAKRLWYLVGSNNDTSVEALKTFIEEQTAIGVERYNTKLYSATKKSALKVPVVRPEYTEESKVLNGYQVINKYFDTLFAERPEVVAFGEDVGQIGDVNQGFAGLQEKYGKERVFDAGIREWSIMGQALGLAMRGMRPIVEIQYLDYLIYGLEPLSDDLATLRYRTNGQQIAPAIIRTRGHRLEGIWHAGSPMGMMINTLKGMYVCVPRNLTQAAGFYTTLLKSDDPGIIVECLNGYRLKERLPENIGSYTVPLGVPEVLQEGTDVTLVTYGSCIRIAEEAIALLSQHGISVELIDVQTLVPFDLEGGIVQSLKKTNRIVFLDEDVPGGATSYMLQEVIEKQGGYRYLDSAPVTISAAEHKTPYGSDGDYFTKPSAETIFDTIYKVMQEVAPSQFTIEI